MLQTKVTTYDGILILELLAKHSSDAATISEDNPSRIGQVIHDTENNLGVSEEAIELLKTIKRGNDDIGDIDWFQTTDGKSSFGWLGGSKRLFDPLCD